MKRTRKWVAWGTIVVAILFVTNVISTVLWLRSVTMAPPPVSEISDAAIILFGGFDGEEQLDAESIRRSNYAHRLFEEKRTRMILCVGGARKRQGLYGSELVRNALGLPGDCIAFEQVSHDTVSNLEQAVLLMHQYGLKRAMVVSSPIHVSRARDLASSLGISEQLTWAPYDYDCCRPEVSGFELWRQVHHEWLARLARSILPTSLYGQILGRLRD